MTFFHKLKVGLAKDTGKKKIVQSNESLRACQETLRKWTAGLGSLINVIDENITHWTSLLGTYISLESSAGAIYSENDSYIRGCLNTLQQSKLELEGNLQSDRGSPNGLSTLEAARAEVVTVTEKISATEAAVRELIENIRQANYYEAKVSGLRQAEGRRKNPSSSKQQEKMDRNQKNTHQSSSEVLSLTSRIRVDMDLIDQERLQVSDRAISAFLHFQKTYFDSKVYEDAYKASIHMNLGTRIPPRETTGQVWALGTPAVIPQPSSSTLTPSTSYGIPQPAASQGPAIPIFSQPPPAAAPQNNLTVNGMPMPPTTGAPQSPRPYSTPIPPPAPAGVPAYSRPLSQPATPPAPAQYIPQAPAPAQHTPPPPAPAQYIPRSMPPAQHTPPPAPAQYIPQAPAPAQHTPPPPAPAQYIPQAPAPAQYTPPPPAPAQHAAPPRAPAQLIPPPPPPPPPPTQMPTPPVPAQNIPPPPPLPANH